MATLSITTAWNETVQFVRREGRLLFPISFMLSALPLALLQALSPEPPSPDALPEPGIWLALVPIWLLASLIANLAISLLALRPGTAVGEALARGAARLPVLFGAYLLLTVAAMAAMFVIMTVVVVLLPGALTAAEAGQPTSQLGVALLLVTMILLPLLLYCGARLTVVTPAGAAEQQGPVGLIRRSWQLTRGHAGKLVGFLLLFFVGASIAQFALQAVTGVLFTLLFGAPEPGSLSALLVIIVLAGFNTVLTAYLASMLARIYAQLSDEGVPSVFA
jgi:hypothetical protein